MFGESMYDSTYSYPFVPLEEQYETLCTAKRQGAPKVHSTQATCPKTMP